MVKCSFCGREEHALMGVHLIQNDGTVAYYCSSKCRRNALKLKRDKKKLKWTEFYRINLQRIAEKEKRVEKEKQDKIKREEESKKGKK